MFYLFLFHLTSLSEQAIEPFHPHPFRVPFLVHTFDAKVYPAYYVRKGIAHYGYQIVAHELNHVELKITLCLLPLIENRFIKRIYELVRLHLFPDSGSLTSLHYFDLIIEHQWPRGNRKPTIRNQWGKVMPEISNNFPLPYYQSPIPHPDFTQLTMTTFSAIQLAVVPFLTSIGNETFVRTAPYYPNDLTQETYMPADYSNQEFIPTLPSTTLNKIVGPPRNLSRYFMKFYDLFIGPYLLSRPSTHSSTRHHKAVQTDGTVVIIYHPIEIGTIQVGKDLTLRDSIDPIEQVIT